MFGASEESIPDRLLAIRLAANLAEDDVTSVRQMLPLAKSERRRAKGEERKAKSDVFHPTRNGFVARSSPMVVKGPCPGTTMVSSGSASTGPCNDCMIFLYEPPGRSVRPIEPANSVSPAISFFCGAKYRQMLPSV